jgi:hypothetical protein
MNQVLAQGVKIIVTVGHFPLRLTCRPVVDHHSQELNSKPDLLES